MKKLVLLVIISSMAISCNKVNSVKDNLENQEFTTETIKKVFDEVSKIKVSDLEDPDNNGIYINYKWDSKNEKIILEKIEEKKLDFFPIFFRRELGKEEGYNVYCEKKDESGKVTDGWEETCTGTMSCGKIIQKCLKEGGCATICEQKMLYTPQTKSFFLNIMI